MHIILTGATGTTGAAVLQCCLASPNITRVSILSRRQFALPAGENLDIKPKAHIIVHEDYTSYPDELLKMLKGAEGCIWAQGIGQNDVSKDEYIRITHDYPLAAAKAFSSLSSTGKFNFIYVSAYGADPHEESFLLYRNIKGRAEGALLELPSAPVYVALRVYNVRPGYIEPPEFHRPRPLVRKVFMENGLALALKLFMPSLVSPTGPLSKVLVDLATGDGNPLQEIYGNGIEAGGRTVESLAIRLLGDESWLAY